MATTEERMQILKMIEEGKISAGDGAELLRALDQRQPQPCGRPVKRRQRAALVPRPRHRYRHGPR